MKLKLFRAISFLALCACMLLIFRLSGETAAESSQTSGGFSKVLLSALYPPFREFSPERQAEIIAAISNVIRKTAHFSVYGLLGFCALMTMISYRRLSFLVRHVAAFLICVLYAATDEWHQTFVVGRSGELRDVLIDSCGALTAIVAAALIMRFTKRLYALVRTKSGEERGNQLE